MFDWLRLAGHRLVGRILPGWKARYLPGVVGRVHRSDTMLFDESPEGIALYLRAGNSAIDNLATVLERAGRGFDDVTSCLDFGCGHGRVLRLVTLRPSPRTARTIAMDDYRAGFEVR